LFKFTQAVSFAVNYETQAELDYFWEKLSAGGDPKSQQCGWLKDKFGLSWQIVPTIMRTLFTDRNASGSQRAMEAMLRMKKLDIAELERARAG
jgi:predicted 3-demethylubiquinone-9 3-methyltransferase (glyoxalase superfamily)